MLHLLKRNKLFTHNTRSFSFTPRQQDKVVVVGGGLMGSGIVQVCSEFHQVTLVDTNEAAVTKCMKSIASNLDRIAKKKFTSPDEGQQFVAKCLANIRTSDSAERAVVDADLLIEAIVENVEIKKAFFKQLDAKAPQNTIFASNTSSFSILTLSSDCKPERRAKFGGLHFFNPVPMMKLVEVVNTAQTAPQTHQYLLDFCKGINKAPITCKDTPGFVVNRLLCPYIMEAIRLLERGVASKEDIDSAMKLGAGYPMGPLELADFVGLDTLKAIVDGWRKLEPDQQIYAASPLLDNLVKEGKFGKKAGAGFYDYAPK